MNKEAFKKRVEAFYELAEQKPIKVIKFTSRRKLKKYLKTF